jgi:mono/diheme cytochrome c family protein
VKRFFYPLLGLVVLGAAAFLLVHRRDFSQRHFYVFSEMRESPAYESQESNPVFRDGKTLQAPVPGTIARGELPLHYGPGKAERKRAGKKLKNPLPATLEVMNRGKKMFGVYCSHCHGDKGRGNGKVAKAFPGFAFPIAGKSALDMPDGEVFHIISHGRNQMPSHAAQITPKDRWALIHYLRDLQQIEVARLGPMAEIPQDPRRLRLVSKDYGREIFQTNCASCHGSDGRSAKPGMPTLNSPVVLAVADDKFYWDLINHGRKGSSMPAWKDILTPTQIKSLISYIRSWAPEGADRAKILSAKGDVRRGSALYRGHCSGCHGGRGAGGIGISLNSKTFQAMASDAFLRDTIVMGRGHTAMPASYDFDAEEVADIISYLRSWNPEPPRFAQVKTLLPQGDAKMGRRIFRSKCSACHGKKGQGGFGTRLASPEFLQAADDKFLYRSIVEGRPGTAMPAWFFLSAQDIADVMTYVRSFDKTRERGEARVPLAAAPKRGRPEFGELLFKKNCSECHGQQGEGGKGPQLSNPVLLDAASDAYLAHAITQGRSGTEMVSMTGRKKNPLSRQDVGHLIAYLRKLEKNPPVDLKKAWASAPGAAGREIYEKTGGCAACHGKNGEGASGPALANKQFLKAASDGFIAGTVILGREGTEMLSFSRGGNVNLNSAEIRDLVGYIRGFEKEDTVRLRKRTYPASMVSQGRPLYQKNCASCHGSEGKGRKGDRISGFGPALNNQEFLQAASDDLLLATIAVGRPNTAMRPFGTGMGGIADLSGEEIRRIVAYIRSWEKK